MKDWKFLFEKYVLGQHNPNRFPEPEVLETLREIHGDLFVDVGANAGMYPVRLSKNFKRTYCFEPNPKTLGLLVANLARPGLGITIFPIALSDRKGKTVLYLDPHKGFSGSADTILPVFEYRPNLALGESRDFTYIGQNGVEVETNTYDNLVKDSADLVKIDVEGAEFMVLAGMAESLKHGKIKRILVELHNRDRDTELESILHECRFETRWLDADRMYGILGR